MEVLKPHGVETNLRKSNSTPRQNCLILTKTLFAEGFPVSPILLMEDYLTSLILRTPSPNSDTMKNYKWILMKKVEFNVRVITIPKSSSRAGSNTSCQNFYLLMFHSAALKSSHHIARRNQKGK